MKCQRRHAVVTVSLYNYLRSRPQLSKWYDIKLEKAGGLSHPPALSAMKNPFVYFCELYLTEIIGPNFLTIILLFDMC